MSYLQEKLILKDQVERTTNAIPCPDCNGYADRDKCTPEELKLVNCCGRTYECCGRVFVCRICKKRILAQADAPEME